MKSVIEVLYRRGPQLALALISLSVLSAAAETPQAIILFSDGTLVQQGDPAFPTPGLEKDTLTESRSYNGITFNMHYESTDSWIDASATGQARLDTLFIACEYIASVLNEPGGVLDTEISSRSSAEGAIASAGPYLFFSSSQIELLEGCAMEHLKNGAEDPSMGYADMVLNINWFHDYNLGDKDPEEGEYDLLSVLIHEFTHALGFFSLIRYPSGAGLLDNPAEQADFYSVYDSFLQTGNGLRLINDSLIFSAPEAALLGHENGVFWAGPRTEGLLGESAAIYAPDPWRNGSSLTHWDEITPQAMMNPTITVAELKRAYEPFEIAMLRDLGYDTRDPGEGEAEGASEGEGAAELYHSGDYIGPDNAINLSELLRFIQLYNAASYHCAQEGDVSDEGYIPGPGEQSCIRHLGDYALPYWEVDLSELLRFIQFYNASGYHVCADPLSDEGLCPGPPLE